MVFYITIHTIGFGDFVNENYLKSLAAYTNGSYHKIFNKEELRWVLDDIYQKQKNSYSIAFDKPNIEIKKFFLKLCYEKLYADSLFVDMHLENDLLDSTQFAYYQSTRKPAY